MPPSRIPGRGGAVLSLWTDTPAVSELIIACGASREQGFNDFWLVKVDKKELRVSDAYELPISKPEGFQGRNSMAGVSDLARSRVVYFGGIDMLSDTLFNDILILSKSSEGEWQLTRQDGLKEQWPVVRNSHSLTLSRDGNSAYLFGGANKDGPLDDLWRLDLETLVFTEIKLSGLALPKVEMHTAHAYQEDQLMIIGGRGIKAGKSADDLAFLLKIYGVSLATSEVTLLA